LEFHARAGFSASSDESTAATFETASQEKSLALRERMANAQGMAHCSPRAIPGDLRARLEGAGLLAPFRTLDRMDLAFQKKPQGCLWQLLERDADYAEALGSLDQPEGVWITVPCSAILSPHWTSCR
jgi:hypothetical protein